MDSEGVRPMPHAGTCGDSIWKADIYACLSLRGPGHVGEMMKDEGAVGFHLAYTLEFPKEFL